MSENIMGFSSPAALFGFGLKAMVEGSVPLRIIADWAYRFFKEYSVSLPKDLELDIMRILAMQGLPELEMSHVELASIADRYLEEG